MVIGSSAVAFDVEETLELLPDLRFCFRESGVISADLARPQLIRQIVADGVRQNKVAIHTSLKQGVGSQSVGPVVGEVALSDGIEPRNACHELIVHPQPAHRKVGSRGNHHWPLVGVMPGNFLIHPEEVAVAFPDRILPVLLNGVGKVEIDRVALRADAKSGIDAFLSST